MKKHIVLLPLTIFVLIYVGCFGGKPKVAMLGEARETFPDTGKNFLFAETEFLNIGAVAMAEQFFSDRVALTSDKIDSVIAEDAVYNILLDSLLGVDAGGYKLSIEDRNLDRQYLQLRYDKVMRLLYEDMFVKGVVIPDSTVLAAYEEQKDQLKRPDEYLVHHIVISGHGLQKTEDSLLYRDKSEEEMDSLAYAILTDVRQKVLNGEPFADMAVAYSQDPGTVDLGGRLGYISPSNMVAPFDSTIENTPVGEISEIIKTVFGWHFLKIEDFIPEHYIPLDSIYQDIEGPLRDGEIRLISQKFADSIHRGAVLSIDTAALIIDDTLHESWDPLAVAFPEDKQFGSDTLYFVDYSQYVYPYQRSKGISRPLELTEKLEIVNVVSYRLNLLRASRVLGYYTDPEVESWAETTMKKYLISILKKRLMDEGYKPPEEEVRAYYETHISNYSVERPINVQQIIFTDSNLAEHCRDLLNSGVDFMGMVDEYYPGDPDIRRSAANLGFIGPDDMPEAFWIEARRTPVGGLSNPVKTMYGYHVIKVIEKRNNVRFETAAIKIRPFLKKVHLDRIRLEYVLSKLGEPPIINWDRLDELYQKELPPPDFSQYR